MLDSAVRYERVSKNRVKNLLVSSIDVVPIEEKGKLNKYTKQYKSEELGYEIVYQRPEFKDFGRIKEIPFTGLGTFGRAVRGYLANGVYTDVDMVNCHPRIIENEFEVNGIDCKVIRKFTDNREEFLKRENITKEEFLRMVNKEDYEGHSEDVNFIHSQIYGLLVPIILKNYPEMAAQVRKSRLRNKNGALVANYLQHKEFAILNEVYKVCVAHELSVDVFMHDGFFVRMTPEVTKERVSEVIPKLTEAVMDKFGFGMEFKIKEHDLSLVDLIDNNCASGYGKMKADFELEHCKIINKSLFVKETKSGYQLFTEKGLMVSYKHLNFQENGETVSFIMSWLKDSSMRIYTDLDCFPKPELCPKDIYNIWKPFRVTTLTVSPSLEADGLNMILNHIRILCGNEDVVFEWFCRWIGHMLVFPERKTFCPVLISKQGGGKGRLLDLMRQLLGASKVFECTTPDRDVWGQFNGRMKESFLVNINELSKKSTFDSMGQIKGLITDEDITINEKGVAQYTTRSYHRFIITTNSDDPIETSYDDRRFLIIRASDEKCGDSEYFTGLMDNIQDDSVIVACYKHFTSLEGLEKFHSEKLPTTSFQDNLRENSLTPIETWIRDCVCAKAKSGEVKYTNAEVYNSFKTYCLDNGIKYETSCPKLNIKLLNLRLPGVANGRSKVERLKTFNIAELRKHFKIEESMFVDEEDDEELEVVRG